MSNSYFRVKADGLFDEAFEGADRSRSHETRRNVEYVPPLSSMLNL
ncbi:unnamed protein product, partial [Fusarium graminearum]